MKISNRTINNGRQLVLQTRRNCWVVTLRPNRLRFAHRYQPSF
jgi:hypothetical protein